MVPFTKIAKTVGETSSGEEDQEFSFGYEMLIRYLVTGNVK